MYDNSLYNLFHCLLILLELKQAPGNKPLLLQIESDKPGSPPQANKQAVLKCEFFHIKKETKDIRTQLKKKIE